ncbi:MAG TPA: VWA domain-containing protein [Chloroflexia bacterium]|nr:VWA domain-containing protein [Chloroflexia bacterium]
MANIGSKIVIEINLGNRLTQRWIAFGRLLRRNGVETTSGQVRDLLRVLPLLDLSDRESVYFASRALLCSRREDLPRFDLTFRQFWGRTRQIIIPSDTGSLVPQTSPDGSKPEGTPEPRQTPKVVPSMERTILADADNVGKSSAAGDDQEGQLERALLYSTQERLRHLDFARFTEEELAAARALMASWRWEPGLRRTRRLAAARRGRRLDFPRTLRRAMRTSGVPYSLAMRAPRRKPRPLVLLCDVSGSMAPYTRMLLHFLHTVLRGTAQAEVFVFGTRLTRITRQLRARNVDQALADVGRQVVDWSGGTRTGEALRVFNTTWGRRVLGQGAVVCVISDGWDRGDPTLLAAEMAHLQRTAFRLIWLNPLLGLPGYRPLTRGMSAALPFVDDFLPVNDIASLESLARLLSSLDFDVRPDRRQIILPKQPVTAVPPIPRFSVMVGTSSGN